MRVRYTGPHIEVEIAATRQKVKQGDTVDVPAAVGRELVKQADWKKVATKKKDED